MSGFIAIFHKNGRRIKIDNASAITSFIRHRGPDGLNLFVSNNIALGHARFITAEYANEKEPAFLDGRYAIVSDARIDDRFSLLNALQQSGRRVPAHATDARLILSAYAAWGKACVQRLIGDFAFVIWDDQEKEIFAARDRLGIRGLYYVETASFLLISNEMRALLLYPGVPATYNAQAIADFLIFHDAAAVEPDATPFKAVKKLIRGAYLTADQRQLTINRYWDLSCLKREPLHFRSEREYIDRFIAVLSEAVRDRCRNRRLGISLSGGMDSTAVAAMLSRLRDKGLINAEINAMTMTDERSVGLKERHLGRNAARHLGFTWSEFNTHEHPWLTRNGIRMTLDIHPWAEWLPMLQKKQSALGRTVFRGFWLEYGLISFHEKGMLVSTDWQHLIPGLIRGFLDFGQKPQIRQFRNAPSINLPENLPPWISQDLERDFSLAARFAYHQSRRRKAVFTHQSMLPLMESPDALCSHVEGFPVEEADPGTDLRLITFLARVHTLPWKNRKYLVRRSLNGLLPEAVLRRPKATGFDAYKVFPSLPEASWLDQIDWHPDIAEYVDTTRLPARADIGVETPLLTYYAVLFLNKWLCGSGSCPPIVADCNYHDIDILTSFPPADAVPA